MRHHQLQRHLSHTAVILIILILLLITPLLIQAAALWQNVGPVGISQWRAGYISLAIDGSNIPFVAYTDDANGDKATLQEFNPANNAWEAVGSAGFSVGPAYYISLALDGGGIPYVAFHDYSRSRKATVMKYNAGTDSWDLVGTRGFSAGEARYVSLALDTNAIPYVAYQDDPNGDEATVMKYNAGTDSWDVVGAAGFSAGRAEYLSIALDGSDTPYVAYRDFDSANNATVMMYNTGTGNWDVVGAAGFASGSVNYTSLALDGSDTPYVAYQDGGNLGRATVMKYNSGTNTWEPLGAAGFSAGSISYTSLEFDNGDNPYVAYRDGGNANKATLMKYNSAASAWENVGSAGFSTGIASYVSLGLDGNNMPYVAYRDGGNSDKATLMKYDLAPDLEASKADNGGGTATVGTAFNWNVTVANIEVREAKFNDGQIIFRDDLPIGASYGAPSVQNPVDITNSGNIDCYLVTRGNAYQIECAADGAVVTIGANTGKFDVVLGVTPSTTGDLVNPVGGGVCQVDPDNLITEDDETNNDCSDTVPVGAGSQGGTGSSGGANASEGQIGFDLSAEGGAFTYGPVRVLFPKLSLSILEVDAPSSGNNVRLGSDGRVFDIIVRDYSGKILSEFDFPIGVCIKPSSGELSAAGGNANLLNIFHKHEGAEWDVLETFVDGSYVCATVNKLSLFGLGVPLVPEVGFAPNVVIDLPEQPAEKVYSELASASHLDSDFRLEIPTLDLELPIVGVPLTIDGWDVTWLDNQVGYLYGTAFPTWAGNTALTAHVWNADNTPGPFVDLHTLQHGDQIIIDAWGQQYVYEVRATRGVRSDDLSFLPHSDYDVLTLITCQGYDDASGEYDWRLAVRAVLVDIK